MVEAAIGVLGAARNRLGLLLLAVGCLALMASTAAARSVDAGPSACAEQAQNCATGTPDSHFAIGDFDGDRQPDVATVETARFNLADSRYSISFQLSQGRAQTIGVTGPAGGLVLIARDVNGDRALDLVLVTAWRHELVAVLLNDGRGNFAAANAAQFGLNTVSAASQFRVTPARIDDRTIAGVQYSFAGNLDGEGWAGLHRETKLSLSRSLQHVSKSLRSASSGRAPPSALS
jgi:hypothetical protein